MTEQAANIEAIERYIGGQVPVKTADAARVRDDFLRYMAGVGTFAREFDSSVYDRVRNFKLAFNRANATTAEEKAAVEEQALHGLSSEELRGEGDRRQTDGSYVPGPSLGERFVPVAIGAGALALLLLLVKRR